MVEGVDVDCTVQVEDSIVHGDDRIGYIIVIKLGTGKE